MGWQVIIHGVDTACAVSEYMIGVPLTIDYAATDLTATGSFLKNKSPLRRGKAGPRD
jgi:hypothetical protein